MAAKNELTGKDVICVTDTETNSAAVVTVNSPSASLVSTIYVTGIILSASDTIGAAVTATLAGVVGGTLSMELPSSKIAPVVLMFGVHPLKITAGQNAVLTLPALGGGVDGTASLLYYIGAA